MRDRRTDGPMDQPTDGYTRKRCVDVSKNDANHNGEGRWQIAMANDISKQVPFTNECVSP